VSVLTNETLLQNVGRILASGGVLGLVSPYLSDFKYWGSGRGSQRKNKKFLTQMLLSATLENDGRVFLVTDPESPSRPYSKNLIEEITNHKLCFWVYLFLVPNLHAKVVCNNYEAIIGSVNLTYGGFKKNVEIGYHLSKQQDVSDVKSFINNLVYEATPGNPAAEALKSNLTAEGLWNKSNIFDMVNLISYGHYLLRTTRIHCIWHRLEEPPELVAFRSFMAKFESEHGGLGVTLEDVYEPLDEDDDSKDYNLYELKNNLKRIKDVIKLFHILQVGDITGPFDYFKYTRKYKNPKEPPPITVLHISEEENMELVSRLIEERIKTDFGWD